MGNPPSEVEAVNVTSARPLLNPRPEGTLLAVPITGVSAGSRLDEETIPILGIRRSNRRLTPKHSSYLT